MQVTSGLYQTRESFEQRLNEDIGIIDNLKSIYETTQEIPDGPFKGLHKFTDITNINLTRRGWFNEPIPSALGDIAYVPWRRFDVEPPADADNHDLSEWALVGDHLYIDVCHEFSIYPYASTFGISIMDAMSMPFNRWILLKRLMVKIHNRKGSGNK